MYCNTFKPAVQRIIAKKRKPKRKESSIHSLLVEIVVVESTPYRYHSSILLLCVVASKQKIEVYWLKTRTN